MPRFGPTAVAGGLCWLASFGCRDANEATSGVNQASLPPAVDNSVLVANASNLGQVVVSDRAGKIALYPCESCHDKIEEDSTARELPKHHRSLEFKHFPGVNQCYFCHSADNMNELRLLGGGSVSLGRASQVCGQCHGEKRHDWLLGAHGKSVGSWSGTRYRLACPDCHNPHKPRPVAVTALPAPPRARTVRRETGYD